MKTRLALAALVAAAAPVVAAPAAHAAVKPGTEHSQPGYLSTTDGYGYNWSLDPEADVRRSGGSGGRFSSDAPSTTDEWIKF